MNVFYSKANRNCTDILFVLKETKMKMLHAMHVKELIKTNYFER